MERFSKWISRINLGNKFSTINFQPFGFANSDDDLPTFAACLRLYLQVRSCILTVFATLAISFPRKLLQRRLELPLVPFTLLPARCLWRFWLFSIRSQEARFSLSHPAPSTGRRSRVTHRRCTVSFEEGLRTREGGEVAKGVRALESLSRGDSRPLRNERELIHCARILAVISGRRVGRRRVVVTDPPSLLFSTRVPSFGPPATDFCEEMLALSATALPFSRLS